MGGQYHPMVFGAKNYMGGCRNFGPFLGTLKFKCRNIIEIHTEYRNFDNHPHRYHYVEFHDLPTQSGGYV